MSLWMILTILAAVLVRSLLMSESSKNDHPYYSSSWSEPLQPVALVFMGISHLWLLSRKKIASLPPVSETNRNKVAIVTGANTGIGYETAKTLVKDYGWRVVLGCRSKDKALRAMESINNDSNSKVDGGEAIVLENPLDLSDFESIAKFSEEFTQRYSEGLDALVNNAGRNTSGQSGKFDLMFQSNFLGHFFLSKKLLAQVQKKRGRVINLSSVMHHFSGSSPLDEGYWKSMALFRDDRPPETYAASKVAAILFTKELNSRYSSSLSSIAVNPGATASDIWRDFPLWIQQVMKFVFLSPQQASVPVVASLVVDTFSKEDIYLQPYWQLNYQKTPFPPTEMLGAYIGFMPTRPRLPLDGGELAGASLWKVSEELISSER